MSGLSRRQLLGLTATSLAVSSSRMSLADALFATHGTAPRILLRSSWQVVNIGDIAHSPGVLALLEQHVPKAQVTLWASSNLSAEVAAMLRRRFPTLRIVKGTINENGKCSNGELAEAVSWSDLLLHGSGPSLVAAKDVSAYVKHVRKPFGVYGITLGANISAEVKELLGRALFLFFRDTVSLNQARNDGVTCPLMDFAPDGAFAFDIRDDERAERFLAEHQLEPGKFLCCLTRLRFTPYWTIPGDKRPFDKTKHARNEAMKEHDHRAIREAIVAIVRDSPMKVLLCPEDMTQMAVGKEMLVDQLPQDIRPHVVWREKFWLPDEALSTYVRSAGVFGSEMHSPIMAIGNGVPAVVCRFEEQTSKGFMWRDIGLKEWLFDLDRFDEQHAMVPTILSLATNSTAAKMRALEAKVFVQSKQLATMRIVGESISK